MQHLREVNLPTEKWSRSELKEPRHNEVCMYVDPWVEQLVQRLSQWFKNGEPKLTLLILLTSSSDQELVGEDAVLLFPLDEVATVEAVCSVRSAYGRPFPQLRPVPYSKVREKQSRSFPLNFLDSVNPLSKCYCVEHTCDVRCQEINLSIVPRKQKFVSFFTFGF